MAGAFWASSCMLLWTRVRGRIIGLIRGTRSVRACLRSWLHGWFVPTRSPQPSGVGGASPRTKQSQRCLIGSSAMVRRLRNAQNEPRTCQNGGLRRRMAARGGDETKPMGFAGGVQICGTNPCGRPRDPKTARTNPRSQRRGTRTARTKPRSSGWKGLHRSEELRDCRAAKGRGAIRRNKAAILGGGRDCSDWRSPADRWWPLSGRLSR